MAKSKQNQWIPSGGVLAVALGAAVAAAILVTVYTSQFKKQYEYGSKEYVQMLETVEQGNPVLTRHLASVRIPKSLQPAFAQAIEAKDTVTHVLKKQAPRKLHQGEFLWYPDFLPEAGVPEFENLPRGYRLMTIPIEGANTLGRQLQPGRYVTIHGDFDLDPDEKKESIEVMKVMDNVQVKGVGGSPEPVTEKRRSYDNIQIKVRETQVDQLLNIQHILKSKRFTITLTRTPEGAESTDPQVSAEVLRLIESKPAAPRVGP